jgi:hypothetical protein
VFQRFHGPPHTGAPFGAASRRGARHRQERRWHPDLNPDVKPMPALPRTGADAALDFVDMSAVVDRIHASFFHRGR